MRYSTIIENIEGMIKQHYPKAYVVNVEKQGLNYRDTDKIEVVLVDERFSEDVVYKKTLQAINSEVKEFGISKYITELRILLGKYVRKTFSRGDIFWGSNDIAHGCEQKGHRPYIIISNNKNNNYAPLLTVVPVTTQDKKYLPTHKTIFINGTKSTALCEQITTIEKTDLLKYIRSLTLDEFKNIEEGVKVQLALNKSQEEVISGTKRKKKGWLARLLEKIKKLFKGEKKNVKRS